MHKQIALLFCGLLSLSTPGAFANTIRETQPLTFGTVAITGAFPQDIIITPAGTESHSPGILPLRGHSNGVFEITELPPSAIFTVMINDTVVDGPANAIYDITDFTFAPDSIGGTSVADGASDAQADGTGNLRLRIGATLRIQNGTPYAPGAYRGTYQLVLNF